MHDRPGPARSTPDPDYREDEDEDKSQWTMCVCGLHFVDEPLCDVCLTEGVVRAYENGLGDARNEVYARLYHWAWYTDKALAGAILATLRPVFDVCIHCGALADGYPSCPVCLDRATDRD